MREMNSTKMDRLSARAEAAGWASLPWGPNSVRFEKGFSDRLVLEVWMDHHGEPSSARSFIISDDGVELVESPFEVRPSFVGLWAFMKRGVA